MFEHICLIEAVVPSNFCFYVLCINSLYLLLLLLCVLIRYSWWRKYVFNTAGTVNILRLCCLSVYSLFHIPVMTTAVQTVYCHTWVHCSQRFPVIPRKDNFCGV